MYPTATQRCFGNSSRRGIDTLLRRDRAGRSLSVQCLQTFMQSTRKTFRLQGVWKGFCAKARDDPSTVFFTDTELMKYWLVELAILDAWGRTIVSCIVLHEKMWAGIVDNLDEVESQCAKRRLLSCRLQFNSNHFAYDGNSYGGRCCGAL